MKTFALATLGCKANQYDGTDIKRQLSDYREVDFGAPANLYIINACGVTNEAEAKARALISRARRAAPQSRLVLTGCYRPAEAERLASLGVDLFVPNTDKQRLRALLADSAPTPPTPTVGTNGKPKRVRAFVKVQDGCSQRCSYCAIPDFRGPSVSRRLEEVVSEVESLAQAGVPEVVLTGIHLGHYGLDLPGETGLVRLVSALLDDTTIPRLRLSSLEPNEVSNELIRLLVDEPRIARHLHLPLQSGSDRILKSMNRPYDTPTFLKQVESLRAALPVIAITTDIMVGFPGETEADFADTLALAEAAQFSRLHVFKFSPRPGTPAADFTNTVPEPDKTARSARLRELSRRLQSDFAADFVGSTVETIIEPPSDGVQTGLTGEYLRVKFNRVVGSAGTIHPTLVESSADGFLIGRVLND